jgi:hypothetical protein
MTKEEFEINKDILYSEYQRKGISLMKEYIKANNPVKIGDIVADYATSIKVERITNYLSNSEPCAIYLGIELTKKGLPKKAGTIAKIYQCNMESHQNLNEHE